MLSTMKYVLSSYLKMHHYALGGQALPRPLAGFRGRE